MIESHSFVVNTDAAHFSEEVSKDIAQKQDAKLEVEIQYSSVASSQSESGMVYTALILGRTANEHNA